MIHDDVARERDLPARRLAARALNRRLSCEDDQGGSAAPTPRTLVRSLDARPLTRDPEVGR
ncbi:hypothetical protein LN042_32250 [Kitasatospora sp. RB6PN24]|uniref:hypothetical protein n=1 Tax=Kitasatospora humi TaxID=2893891 RepID=UPI001E5FA8B9|nr:hypothetical protein [Kitasatospora humi]MCC9311685.1 hypothetical protein [Kitasatospora humi]